MAKRFTDTNKYKKRFFKSLPGAYKLFWDYLYHDCDHAGIWIVDFEIAQIYLGNDMKVSETTALELFNQNENRIMVLDSGSKWFIKPFIEFQYGVLSSDNRAHNSVIKLLTSLKLYDKNKGVISPLQGAKDKDKDTLKDKDKDMVRPPAKISLGNSPDKNDVKMFFAQQGIKEPRLTEMSKSFYYKWESTNWTMNGSRITNWASLADRFIENWKKNEGRNGYAETEVPVKKLPTVQELMAEDEKRRNG
jgi:hypothetical protein